MNYAWYLTEQFGKDPKITSLLKKARVILVPVMNVDGFNYSRESVQSLNQSVGDLTSDTAAGNGFEGYWRKNRRSLTGVTVPACSGEPRCLRRRPEPQLCVPLGRLQRRFVGLTG